MSCKDSWNLELELDFEFFISIGTLSHSFEPIEDAVSIPYLTVHGMLLLQLDWFLRLYGRSAISKTPFISCGAIPVLTLSESLVYADFVRARV